MAEQKNDTRDVIQGVMYRQVSFWLSIGGIAFGVFIYLTTPSADNNLAIKIQEQRIIEQQKTIDTITKTQQNDTQEVKGAIKDLENQLQFYSNEIIKLQTIINERIPAKK